MRDTDLARLGQPYPEGTDPTEETAVGALEMSLPHTTALEADILTDFVDHTPYGVGWWAHGPGTSRRILIADQLYKGLLSL
jgi:hypothetical protein